MIPPRAFKSLGHLGHTPHGESIYAEFNFQDHPSLAVTIGVELLPLFMSQIQSAANAALMARAKQRSGGQAMVDGVAAWRARGIILGHAEGHLMMTIDTTRGIPLTVAVPIEKARELTIALTKEVHSRGAGQGPVRN